MSFNLLIPEINNKPKNTKDAVISILTIEWPLSLKQIFLRIKKRYGYSHTYQSVYKAVKELLDKNVLKELKKGYEINIEWVKKVQSFTDIVETNYYAQKTFNDISGISDSKQGKDLIVLNFNSFFDAEKYLYYFIKNALLKKKNEKIFYQIQNEWRPLFYLRAEYNYYKKLMKKGHKFYFLHENNSYLEEISKMFYKNIGVKVKTVKQNMVSDNIVFLDYFIQIFISEELKIKIRQLLEKKELIKLLEILGKDSKLPVRVIINRDSVLANELKKKLLKNFK